MAKRDELNLDSDFKEEKLTDFVRRKIASEEKISELYDLWHKYRCETFRTYTDVMPEKIPLEENEEFKNSIAALAPR